MNKTGVYEILLQPKTYIGSVNKEKNKMLVYNNSDNMIVQKEIEYVPGLYKIFDEILVNAVDKNMTCIKVDIDPELNEISVWNNGQGLPVAMNKEENMYEPTLMFGHLSTSSKYNDEEVADGRNCYGARLCNVFSTKFVVETASGKYKRSFKQTWRNNMTETSGPKIKECVGTDFTRITFRPDLAIFKMDKLDDGIIGLMSRRAFEISASTRGVQVILNGTEVPVKTFTDYIDLCMKNKEDGAGNTMKIATARGPLEDCTNWQPRRNLGGKRRGKREYQIESDSDSEKPDMKICVVCGDRALYRNFSVLTCEGCKCFFRRYQEERPLYKCLGRNDCEVTKKTRNRCQSCRIQKCIAAGMR